ncbi:hypothetical protein NP493_2190g00019 [Ridgeia piscesae]|uniref:Endonuclease-reverse transcriptase n=1 Tax=Ridgeia piscesae TaxID=27915 RepID=A0AAD9JL53_RIDPI|nr:hypothetical protein NP493_2190g00019 [Ridgeia piscesae]
MYIELLKEIYTNSSIDKAPETKPKTSRFKEGITSGWTAFAKQHNIFKGNIGTCLKIQVYDSCVLPYGVETWALITQAKHKLAAAQTKMERSMLNITYRDRKTNIWVREKTKVTDVIEQVRRRKWAWAGHVGRIRDDRWTLSINIWKPRRWRDELVDYWNGTIWLRIAQGTQMWKQHAEVSAQSRDTLAAQ